VFALPNELLFRPRRVTRTEDPLDNGTRPRTASGRRLPPGLSELGVDTGDELPEEGNVMTLLETQSGGERERL
jgi:hypothetical protein